MNPGSKPSHPTSKPDLRFDVDALFAHLVDNLGHELTNEKDWHFHIRPRSKGEADLERLMNLADELSEEFAINFQEETEEVQGDETVIGPALMTVVIQGALMPDEVKSLAQRFAGLAKEQGLVYDGVSSYDPSDDDEFGWLSREDANWRLRALTDSGLPENEPMLFVFAFSAPDASQAQNVQQALQKSGFEDIDVIAEDESDLEDEGDEPRVLIIGATKGRNNEEELAAAYAKAEGLASTLGTEMLGVQFAEVE